MTRKSVKKVVKRVLVGLSAVAALLAAYKAGETVGERKKYKKGINDILEILNKPAPLNKVTVRKNGRIIKQG